jgi:hypothetical protein
MGFARASLAIAVVVLAACGDNIHFSRSELVVSPQAGLRTTEAGGTATFTVALANEPATEVTIELSSLDITEGSVSPSALTFQRSDHSQPQTVTIIGLDDDRADGNRAYTVRVGNEDVDPVDVDVVNQDDDTAGFAVSPLIGLMTAEGGTTAQFEVALLSNPLADVTVPIASSDPSEGMPDLSSLTFTGDDWNVPQIVTVTGQQDLVADGSMNYVVMIGAATSADDDYQGVDPDDVSLLNVDDDVSGIAVNAPIGLVTSEAGAQDSFSVVLQTEPTADVTITVGSTMGTEVTVSPSQLVFTAANWDQPQTVTATGANDFIDDGDRAYLVTLGAATSTDTVYAGLDPDDIPGTNTDDDTAGIVVTPTTSLVTGEDGTDDAFTVVLSSEPIADVTIPVASSDATEGTAAPASLTFTAASWNIAQTVTVTGVDDAVKDGDQAYTVVLSPPTTGDAIYAAIDPSDVAAKNLDDEHAEVIVEPVDGLVVSEFFDTDTFTMVLATAPTAPVTITLASSDTTEGLVLTNSVTFTPANWNVPRTITVIGLNDSLADGNIVFSIITGAASSLDPAYNNLAVPDVEVTNIDNEIAQVYVKSRKELRVSENGQSATFRVRLTLAPTSNVSCTIASSDTSEGTVSPQTIVFGPAQFGFRTVTLTGVNDALVDGDVPFTIVLSACTSMDVRYDGQDPRDIAALNRDND